MTLSRKKKTLVSHTITIALRCLLGCSTCLVFIGQSDAQQSVNADCDSTATSRLLTAASHSTPLDASANWLQAKQLRVFTGATTDTVVLYYANDGQLSLAVGQPVAGFDRSLPLTPAPAEPANSPQTGSLFHLPDLSPDELSTLLTGQLIVAELDARQQLIRATGLQLPGVLDQRYRAASSLTDLGARTTTQNSHFKLWAPTAKAVQLCLYRDGTSNAEAAIPLQRDQPTGAWYTQQRGDHHGHYYTYLVDVYVPNVGVVRNRITDPYSLSLSTNSQRSYIADLGRAELKPAGWDRHPRPAAPVSSTELSIYELHVRDFSLNDNSVGASQRGKYLAFTAQDSHGMRHLRELAHAGLTDIHLLPVFDFATVPEAGCVTPLVTGSANSESQQAAVTAVQANDCYNWGYDPFHYAAPEGSYASDSSNGATRIRELRQLVQALHALGLRVGMDVVYNHTSASGQAASSVLDRIVPGYYQRLNRRGEVETSTCCANTATEHRMMAKLMIDSAVMWARDYQIDSFRFDLMGHQPRAAMEALQLAVNQATGRYIPLIGEGWNFGEIANGARFVQASQLSLNGSGIGSFSDRARDAVRGGGPADSGVDQLLRQGFVNGLFYAPNAVSKGKHSRHDLLRAGDLLRVGLAGSLRDYRLHTYDDKRQLLAEIDYAGQPAGYVSEPTEVVNYVENHDNQTLFDLNVLKLPLDTAPEDRARVQILAAATVAFSQGIAYFHAGQDILRSKSMDRNSFDSGDWFNRIDWTYQDNYFGTGLPPERDNASSWPWLEPLLGNAALKPRATDIAWSRDAFRDLLRLRASSSLFRLPSAVEIKRRLEFLNTGPSQQATVIIGKLDGSNWPGANFRALLYAINVDTAAHTLALPALQGQAWQLHPLHRGEAAADRRPLLQSHFDASTGQLTVPARTAMVYVLE